MIRIFRYALVCFHLSMSLWAKSPGEICLGVIRSIVTTPSKTLGLLNAPRWRFKPEQERELKTFFERSHLDPAAEFVAFSDLVLNAHLSNLPVRQRIQVGRSLVGAVIGGADSGSFYDKKANRVRVGEKKQEPASLALVHEFAHSVEHNSDGVRRAFANQVAPILASGVQRVFSSTPGWDFVSVHPIFDSLVKYVEEFPSIGAQWEVVSRIPVYRRIQMIAALEKKYGDELLRQGDTARILLLSLRYADLGKQEFISRMRSEHGYSLLRLLKKGLWFSFLLHQ